MDLELQEGARETEMLLTMDLVVGSAFSQRQHFPATVASLFCCARSVFCVQ